MPKVTRCPPQVKGECIGLIAGWGRFPLLVAEALRQRDYLVACLGIGGHADRALADICHHFHCTGLARMGAHIRFFRRHGVRVATMAGKIHKILLFRRGYLCRHLPDLKCIRTFFPHFIRQSKDRSDDSLLASAVRGYVRSGIEIKPATDLVPELLVKYGQLSGNRLNSHQRKDVEYGWRLAKHLGWLDVGQTIVIKSRAVLAVEAIEGTDQCIRRAGQLCPSGGFTVVKVAKPQQDMRFDVPTIGVGTVETMHESGANLLAIEADKTIIIDQPAVVRLASQCGISIVAIREGAIADDLNRTR
jgi:hypothetical protein